VKTAHPISMRLLPLVSLSIALCACGEEAPPKPKSSGARSPSEMLEGIRNDAKSTYESAKEAFLARKNQFRGESQQRIEELEERIAELKQKAGTAKADARPELERIAHELEQQRLRASDRLGEWKEQGENAWQSFSSQLERSLQDLDRKVGEALAKTR
jgi:hypothetical protein